MVDVPPEESGELRDTAAASGIDLVHLVAPTSRDERLRAAAGASRGFVYLVAAMGTTGAREQLDDRLAGLIGVVKEAAGDTPVLAGFGISRPEHVRAVLAAGADGVVVGLRRHRRRRPRRRSGAGGVRPLAGDGAAMTEFALVDAFATRPFEGNQAAVILLDEPADAGWMQSLASELGYGATCFLHGRDLRWFAPAVELTFCGHGTLATAHLLWERGATDDELQFSTASGQLTAHRRGSQIEIDLPVQATEPAVVPGLAEALGAEPLAVGRAPLDLVAELASADVVRNLAPDLAAIARIDARGVIVTAAGDDGEHAIVSRFFGPAMGIPEELRDRLGPLRAGRRGGRRASVTRSAPARYRRGARRSTWSSPAAACACAPAPSPCCEARL